VRRGDPQGAAGNGVAWASLDPYALGQLEQRNAAEQVGDSKTWRHRG